MAVAQISILSEGDIESVHGKTIEILDNPGIMVRSERVLDMLERAGARTDRKAQRASLPEDLIDETIRKLPREVRLCARNPKQDMVAPRTGPPYMATNGTAVYMTDIESGARRATTSRDLMDFMVLCDAMDSLDYVWPIVTAHDAPDKTHALSELAISMTNTTKHVQGEAMSAEEARAEIELASVVAGGADALAKRPLFSVVQCPVCPLEFEKGSAEAVVEFAKAGIPVVSMSMALCGLTSPVSLASTIAIVNAENIASFAISQMSKSGAPVVYSSESTVPDMMTGEIHYGAVEELLLAAASAQMARHYGVPSMVGGLSLGIAGGSPGMSANPSELVFGAATSMTLTDFASGIGGLDQAKGASLEQVVIDCDAWETLREMRRDVVMDDAHFAIDLVRSVGPGGSFLRNPHTARNLRKELFMPSKERAALYGAYRLGTGWKEVVMSARERVTKILSSHVPDPLDADTVARMNAVLRRTVP